jgi:hypothetical protein
MLPGREVFEGAGTEAFREPVGHQEGKIETAIAQASLRNSLTVKVMNAQGDYLNFDAGVQGFKETRLFGESVLEVGIVAQGDAKLRHEFT